MHETHRFTDKHAYLLVTETLNITKSWLKHENTVTLDIINNISIHLFN